MSARLADLAAYVGVSEATVSRVLNDKPGVAPATRQAVLTALDVLGYERPSKLRRTSAGLVGLVVPELTNPIFPAFAQALETHLAAAGYTPVLCTQTPGGVHEDEYVQMLLDRGVAAIIFISGYHADTRSGVERYLALRERKLPIALVNGYRPEVPAQFISHDDVAAMHLAVRHLLDLGHRRIAIITGPDDMIASVARVSGFRAALGAAGVPLPEEYVRHGEFHRQDGLEQGDVLLRLPERPTAVFASNDLQALGVYEAARALGLRIPEDLSVVGYDDVAVARTANPPLTTVHQPLERLAEEATRAVLRRSRRATAEAMRADLAVSLVVRRSTAPPAS